MKNTYQKVRENIFSVSTIYLHHLSSIKVNLEFCLLNLSTRHLNVQWFLYTFFSDYRKDLAVGKSCHIRTCQKGHGFAGHFLPFARNLWELQKDLWQSQIKLRSIGLDISISLYKAIYLEIQRTWQQKENKWAITIKKFPISSPFQIRAKLEFWAYVWAVRFHFII